MGVRITQSLIKDLHEYRSGRLCGLIVKAKYIDGIFFPSTEAQTLGHWFEFMATGGKPKYGEVPAPEILKDGKTLSAKYALMESQAKNFLRDFRGHEFKRHTIGATLKHEDQEGTLDIVGERRSTPVIVDLKSSAQLYNKWSDYGWDVDSLDNKERLLIQPVHYVYLYKKIYGITPEFYFFVYSTINEDREIIQIVLDPDRVEQHEQLINGVRRAMQAETQKGFTPIPELATCRDCPLFKECEHKTTIPIIKTVQY